MASLESLPADQRAVLQLVLQRGRSYDQIARLLSMDRAAVRQRAVGALGALGPDTGLPPERRELIADYLLGQLEPEAAEAVRDGIGGSPADRAWARVVASELGPLVSSPLPEIPNGPVPFAPGEPPAAPPPAVPVPLSAEPPAAPVPAVPAAPATPSPPVPAPAPDQAAPAPGKRKREPLFLGRKRGGSAATGDGGAAPAPAPKKAREPLFLGRKRGGATPPLAATGDAEAAPVPAPAPAPKKAREPLFLGRKRGGATPPPAAPGAAAAPADGDRQRSSRLGGLILILLTVVIVAAIVVILLNQGGGSSTSTTASTPAASHSSTAPASASTTAASGAASATTTGSSSSSAKVVAQINLTPPAASSKAAGIAEILKEGTSDGIAIVAQNVTPNTTKPPNAYAVWLYNSPTDAHILGFVNPGVGANGRLSTAGGLPANAAHYKQLIVTLETKASPKTPGQIILQGTLSGL
ncbi:MAG TPA: sigma factor-like helix-turn-helix DNA-binding protein [Solirubrobacteraceae bacterium]|nr:sigma factor-like helix-turn-helix DNA-binding protein [Solirubrobacteraceae bacterium]